MPVEMANSSGKNLLDMGINVINLGTACICISSGIATDRGPVSSACTLSQLYY